MWETVTRVHPGASLGQRGRLTPGSLDIHRCFVCSSGSLKAPFSTHLLGSSVHSYFKMKVASARPREQETPDLWFKLCPVRGH